MKPSRTYLHFMASERARATRRKTIDAIGFTIGSILVAIALGVDL